MAATTIVTGTTERGEPDTPIVEPPVFIWLAPDLATIQTFQWDWVFRKKIRFLVSDYPTKHLAALPDILYGSHA